MTNLTNKLIISTLLVCNLGFSECEQKLDACDRLQKVQDSEIQALKALLIQKDDYEKILLDQREKAYKQLSDSGTSLPWYVWTLVGAAGGIVLIRGIK